MPIPASVLELIERFARNIDVYKRGAYNETQVRVEYIDPLFAALGWDVHNRKGYADAYKEVVHEDAVRVGGITKAPDYSFRIGGVRKFFLEAKKPSVDIRNDVHPAFQVRRYAWSAKLPLSILTDFEEFAVYDCRQKPDKSDSAAVSRVLYLRYTDYAERWDEIAAIFSQGAILTGSFDKYVESHKSKRGTAEVDAAFLAEIERWRDLLARNIALRNPHVSQRELNFAVQQTIDRLIFLRICEDRGIEPYATLMGLQNGSQVYPRLMEIFRQADARYNSGLFHFDDERGRSGHPDRLTPGLSIDDKVLKDILKNLYYPDSPYEFSVLPADILGQVYEQFLGKVIRLTPGRQAKVEEKPEVRKAGGVYYTPTYIVDSIVQQTVGRLVEGRRPGPRGGVSRLRIVDPACGSGSFLIGAYQFLLDWHLAQYVADGPEGWAHKSNPQLYRTERGEWRLTVDERKRILLNNIYGVDIDPQAVEVTKLSLLLKVLEGESEQTLSPQLALLPDRVLPDLAHNIRCGNSLIGSDFYEGRQLALLDEEEAYRLNVFDWESAFPEVFAEGGFDGVIGNPPYIRIQALKEWAPVEVEYYKERYRSASKGNYDIYVVFVEKGLDLLNENGRLGFILPHKFFNAKYGEPVREMVAKGHHLDTIVHFGDQQIFAGATTYTCLLFLDKSGQREFRFVQAHDLESWRLGEEPLAGAVDAAQATASEWNFVVGGGAGLFQRLSEMPVKLGDVANMFVGLQTSADTIFLFKEYKEATSSITEVFSKQLDRWISIETDMLKSVIRSGSIGRYWATPTALVLYPYELINGKAKLIGASVLKSRYPLTWDYLSQNKPMLSAREKGKFSGDAWYQLYPKNLDLWEQKKLLLPYMITRLSAHYDDSANYFVNVTTGGFGVTTKDGSCDLHYLAGLLNSRLLDMHMRIVSTNFQNGYFAANKQFLVQLPIRPINFSDPADAARHDQMVALVQRMLDLHKQLSAATLPHSRDLLQRQIDATDRQIDRLVYELYGLTEAEVRVVEGVDR
ncbi:MAG: Eco57I restriction-modification methylase domain-containing protein [Caldilineaceae bacterium]|nr:Eco57I restriction-modification methylase domain-containing protein [Caldilineaceae bacterium]